MVPVILGKIDPNQFGAIPKSPILQAFISTVHNLAEATDGRVSVIRVVTKCPLALLANFNITCVSEYRLFMSQSVPQMLHFK